MEPSIALGSTVTSMWTSKYYMRQEFMSYFLTEQEYVDAMFAQIILYNFGVWLNTESMRPTAISLRG